MSCMYNWGYWKWEKNKLKENIKNLEDLSINVHQTINELKIMSEKINKNKDELKSDIHKMFTKLRSDLNNREEILISEVDKKYNEIYCNKELFKESEYLLKTIKNSIEKGREIENNWNNNKLNKLINDCLNIWKKN